MYDAYALYFCFMYANTIYLHQDDVLQYKGKHVFEYNIIIQTYDKFNSKIDFNLQI